MGAEVADEANPRLEGSRTVGTGNGGGKGCLNSGVSSFLPPCAPLLQVADALFLKLGCTRAHQGTPLWSIMYIRLPGGKLDVAEGQGALDGVFVKQQGTTK